MNNETKLQAKFIKAAKEFCYIVRTGVTGEAGDPDVFACVAGKFYGLEFKDGSKVSDIQQYKLDAIRKNGGTAIVVTSKNYDEVLLDLKAESDYLFFLESTRRRQCNNQQ
ncbi:MAG: hypothetical protein K0U38_05935 [Epsilonproteobacteria bacterium]|nr:hypothetical protein [Campylobacterota bacterium]